jgi:hypothetical protein
VTLGFNDVTALVYVALSFWMNVFARYNSMDDWIQTMRWIRDATCDDV